METSRQAVEQNLSEIAFASVSEKTPALMDYYLGFDLIEKNDSGTRAAGLMGFKIGKQLVYIPVFFLNGKLKGTDVLYLKNSDVFVSNTEQWVSYIISQSQLEYGGPEDESSKNSPDTSEIQKSLDLFVRPPTSATKTASIEDYSSCDIDTFIDINAATKTANFSLLSFLKDFCVEEFEKVAEIFAQPEIFKSLIKVYSIDEIKEAMGSIKKAEPHKPKESKEISIIRKADISPGQKIAEETLTEIFEKGYSIKNAKEGEDASKVCIEEENERFHEVTESGVYKILNREGKLVEAVVFVGVTPLGAVGSSSGGWSTKLVVDPSNGTFVEAKDVFYRTGNEISSVDKKQKEEILSSAKSVTSAIPNERYILISPNFEVYGPFKVDNKTKVDGKTTLMCSPSYGFDFYCDCNCREDIKIKEVGGDTTRIGRVGNVVYVPSSFRLFKLNGDRYWNSKEIKKVTPGSFSGVLEALTRSGAEKVLFEKEAMDAKVLHNDVASSFSDRGDFVFHLCKNFDFAVETSEKIASELWDKKKRQLSVAFLRKRAYPEVPDPNVAAGTARDGTPQEQQASATEKMLPATQAQLPATDPSFGMWKQPTPEDIAFLERAADSNSREVFDPAMVGILVRTTRSQSIVQEYIPEFVDNLDRMIRLLLLFYWHNAEFAENYGIDQMAEFEDLLLSTIKNTGKTILFLKQKAVDSSKGKSDIF